MHPLPPTEIATDIQTREGIIFDIQRFSVNDGPGIRSIVFFKSCPLDCAWCSNPESRNAFPELMYTRSRCLECGRCVSICPRHALSLTENGIVIDRDTCDACGKCSAICPSGALRMAGRKVTVAQALAEVARDRVFYEHSATRSHMTAGGGMTLSGGEPLTQPEFALALLQGARRLSIHTAVETSGATNADNIRRVLGQTDLILFDLKHLNPDKHRAAIGSSNQVILKNAALAASLGVKMIIRVPVIPGFNDNPHDIITIGRFARDLGLTELHLLPYHKYGLAKYLALNRTYSLPDTVPPPESQIHALRLELEVLGLNVHVGG